MINIFISSIIFSIWCVMLFFRKSIGLSALLFTVPMTIFLIYLLEKNKKVENKKAKILIAPIILLSITYFIFNNKFFNILNFILIPILTLYMILSLLNKDLIINIELFNKMIKLIFLPIDLAGETFDELKETLLAKLKIDKDSEKNKKVKKFIRAILITIPITMIIIAFLASADEIFGSIFIDTFVSILDLIGEVKILDVIGRILFIIVIFIYLICFFDYISKYEERKYSETELEETKDSFTIKMILTVLNLVYLIFCIVQINSLFMKQVDINYAGYARKGFFQLMIVSAINLVVILIAKKREGWKRDKYITTMCTTMTVFTFIILMSATLRMYFYVGAYGYTYLRLLVYYSLFTEVLLLIPTVLYIQNKKIHLAKIYFMIILTVYVGMNFSNFDKIIANQNLQRYIETGKIDMDYLGNSTGTDAVPSIIKVIEIDKDENVTIQAKMYLSEIYEKLEYEEMDFRDLNISKIIARNLIEENDLDSFRYKELKKDLEPDKYIVDNKEVRDKAIEEEKTKEEEDILYEVQLDENKQIKIVNRGSWSGKNIIQILKTIDGGENWRSMLKTGDGTMDVHYGTKFVFLDENLGFINDVGIPGTDKENSRIIVTNDGGQTFKNIQIDFPIDKMYELYCDEVPYIENGTLKLKFYTSVHGVINYINFVSYNQGNSWSQEI